MRRSAVFIAGLTGLILLITLLLSRGPEKASALMEHGNSAPAQSVEERGSALPVNAGNIPQTATVAAPQAVEDVEIELAPGMRAPAFLMPDRQLDLNPIQARVLGEITQEFFDAIKNVPDEQLTEAYERARAVAEGEYRKIFGDEAYMRASADAAVEARSGGSNR